MCWVQNPMLSCSYYEVKIKTAVEEGDMKQKNKLKKNHSRGSSPGDCKWECLPPDAVPGQNKGQR